MGYVAGAIIGLIVAGITGQFLLQDFQIGLLPGLVAALWFGCMINHEQDQAKLNMLFPIPRTYEVPLKQAFPAIKKALQEYSYEYGQTFKVLPNDHNRNEIKANMKWTDVDEVPEPSQHDYGKVRKTTVERFLRLEIYFKPTTQGGNPATTVEIRWFPMAKGLNPRACEPIIHQVTALIDSVVPAEGKTDLPPTQPWIPPAWLHVAVIACLAIYVLGSLGKAESMWEKVAPLQSDRDQKIKKLKDDKKKLEKEVIPEWEQFKKTYRPPDPTPRPNPFADPAPPPVIIKPSPNSTFFNRQTLGNPFSKPSRSNLNDTIFGNPNTKKIKNQSTESLFNHLKIDTSGGGK